MTEADAEYLNARSGLCDPMEVVLSIKRSSHRSNIVAMILTFTIAFAASILVCAGSQSSGTSTPPPPYGVQPQAPARSAPTPKTPDQPSQVVQRTVTVTFNYDFSKYPPCSTKVTKKCIQQFDVWEVSADEPIFLFTISPPLNATGVVTGITGSAPKNRAFFTGPHRIGVSAKMYAPDGASDPTQCMVFVQVLPDNPAPPSQTPASSSIQK
jgi:hypothetical protein